MSAKYKQILDYVWKVSFSGEKKKKKLGLLSITAIVSKKSELSTPSLGTPWSLLAGDHQDDLRDRPHIEKMKNVSDSEQ